MKPLDINQVKDLIIFCKQQGVASLEYENLAVEFADANLVPIEEGEEVEADTEPEEPDFSFSKNLKKLRPVKEDEDE